MPRLTTYRAAQPAGGGAFRLEETTIGVFLTDQPNHRISVGQDRSVVHPLTAHQGWIMPAGAEGLCEFDRPLDFLTVGIDAQLLRDSGLTDPQDVAPVVGALDPLVLSMAENAEAFAQGGTLYQETMARALAAQIVQTQAPARSETRALDDVRLRRAADYIHDHLAEDLSIAGMAELSGMSDSHFAKAFKTATGQSPLQYVIAARMESAGVLLRTTDLPVSEVAYRVG